MPLTPAERAALIDNYAAGPARLRAALARVPAEARQWRPAPGKWSVHEIVVHCADSETNAHMRIRYLMGSAPAHIHGYDQDAWAATFDYHSHPLELALATVDAVRANTVPLLRRMPDAAWAAAGTHSELASPYTAEVWLKGYSEHLDIHVRGIERNLAAWATKR